MSPVFMGNSFGVKEMATVRDEKQKYFWQKKPIPK